MKMVHSSYSEEAVKAFYAISALIRNNERGQELFYLEGGDILLQVLDNYGDSRITVFFRFHAVSVVFLF